MFAIIMEVNAMLSWSLKSSCWMSPGAVSCHPDTPEAIWSHLAKKRLAIESTPQGKFKKSGFWRENLEFLTQQKQF